LDTENEEFMLFALIDDETGCFSNIFFFPLFFYLFAWEWEHFCQIIRSSIILFIIKAEQKCEER